jgi:hypothetical protein
MGMEVPEEGASPSSGISDPLTVAADEVSRTMASTASGTKRDARLAGAVAPKHSNEVYLW